MTEITNDKQITDPILPLIVIEGHGGNQRPDLAVLVKVQQDFNSLCKNLQLRGHRKRQISHSMTTVL